METHGISAEIKKHREEHSFYMFVALVAAGILILQPLTMTFIMVAQSIPQQ